MCLAFFFLSIFFFFTSGLQLRVGESRNSDEVRNVTTLKAISVALVFDLRGGTVFSGLTAVPCMSRAISNKFILILIEQYVINQAEVVL